MRLKFVIAFLLFSVCLGKNYQKCELAYELRDKFSFTLDQVKNFVCIAQFESAFNTGAINNYNWDGSRDFGIFQLNNRYWCGSEYGKNVCNMDCNDLIDDDITDDIECAKKIVKETKRWMKSGNGLEAWTAYVKQCQSVNLDTYISECEDLYVVREQETTTAYDEMAAPIIPEQPQVSEPAEVGEKDGDYSVVPQVTAEEQPLKDSSPTVQVQGVVQLSPETIVQIQPSELKKTGDQELKETPESFAPLSENEELSSSKDTPPVRASGLGIRPDEPQAESFPASYNKPSRVSGMIEIPIPLSAISPELEIVEEVLPEVVKEPVIISDPQVSLDESTVVLQDLAIADQEPEDEPFKIPDLEETDILSEAEESTAVVESANETPQKDNAPTVKVPSSSYYPSITPESLFSQFSLPIIPFRQRFPYASRPQGLLDMLLRGVMGSPSVILVQMPNSESLTGNSHRFSALHGYRQPTIFQAFSSQFFPIPYTFGGIAPSEITSTGDAPSTPSDFRKIPINIDLPEFEEKPVEIPTLIGFRPHEIPLKPLKFHLPEFGSKPLQIPKLGLEKIDIPFPKLQFEKKPISIPKLSLKPLVLPYKKPSSFDFSKILKPIEIPKISKVPIVIPKIPKKEISIDIKPIEIPKINFKPIFSKPSLNIFKKG